MNNWTRQDAANDIDRQPVQPPRLPGPASVTPPPPDEASARGRMSARFQDQFGPLEGRATSLRVVETLLKRPARVVHEVVRGDATRMAAVLLAVAVACLLGYGLIIGVFSGGHQLWVVPVKVVVGAVLSALICLPSLYIFASLSGSDESLSQAWGLLLSALALSGILLAGFAPIAWIFAQATHAVGFMAGLHLVFWGVATCFGLRLLEAAFRFLNKRGLPILRLWSVIYVLVVLQMCTTLRPLVGEFRGFRLQGKEFFLRHWVTCGDQQAPRKTR